MKSDFDKEPIITEQEQLDKVIEEGLKNLNNYKRKEGKKIKIKKFFNSGIFWFILLILVVSASAFTIGWCKYKEEKNKPNINNIAKTIAERNDWFDYSYDLIGNYDENGTKRYHIVYYYSKANTSGSIEYIVEINNNEYVAEIIK